MHIDRDDGTAPAIVISGEALRQRPPFAINVDIHFSQPPPRRCEALSGHSADAFARIWHCTIGEPAGQHNLSTWRARCSGVARRCRSSRCRKHVCRVVARAAQIVSGGCEIHWLRWNGLPVVSQCQKTAHSRHCWADPPIESNDRGWTPANLRLRNSELVNVTRS
jgi:hypothetical protein